MRLLRRISKFIVATADAGEFVPEAEMKATSLVDGSENPLDAADAL
jgi:hypothetical protein